MNFVEWYPILNAETLDTPALAIYPERVRENIRILKTFVQNVDNLRPHMKTNKSPEVATMLLEAGIGKFKCATIAEAEMLATAGAPDVLLAYQPVGPKAERLAALVARFPQTTFSCLVDNLAAGQHLSHVFQRASLTISLYIDLNVGMNRTGVLPGAAFDLYIALLDLPGIVVAGLHAYDGHLRDTDLAVRTAKCNEAFSSVAALRDTIIGKTGITPRIIAGGTPTFPIHAQRPDVECSPGTFVYWDKGYQSILQEQPFLFAALVVSRVVSLPTADTICVDLGHKSIASESPLNNRVYFLNAPELVPEGHSEEHLILRAGAGHRYQVGDILYGVPHHICPTVALHDRAAIVEDGQWNQFWYTHARDRYLTV
jgi:D-threonine aldolase